MRVRARPRGSVRADLQQRKVLRAAGAGSAVAGGVSPVMPKGKICDRFVVHNLDMISEQRHEVVWVLQSAAAVRRHVDRSDRPWRVPVPHDEDKFKSVDRVGWAQTNSMDPTANGTTG